MTPLALTPDRVALMALALPVVGLALIDVGLISIVREIVRSRRPR